MEVTINTLTPESFLALYTSVGWEPPCPEQVEAALRNSTATFTAYHNGQAVGMARLIGDGGMSFYIKDFAVLPSHQAMGVGRLLLDTLENHIRKGLRPGWTVSLELLSTEEAVPFYKKQGFRERPFPGDGPGLLKMISP